MIQSWGSSGRSPRATQSCQRKTQRESCCATRKSLRKLSRHASPRSNPVDTLTRGLCFAIAKVVPCRDRLVEISFSELENCHVVSSLWGSVAAESRILHELWSCTGNCGKPTERCGGNHDGPDNTASRDAPDSRRWIHD